MMLSKVSFSFAAKLFATISCLSLSLIANLATAAEIKVLSGSAVEPAMIVLIPQFEQSSGHKVGFDFDGAIGAMTKRIEKGEAADVIIVSRPQIDSLEKQGKIIPGSRVELAKLGVGVFVRKGAPKPDISSVEAFKRTLLAAKSVAYPGEGASGVYFVSLLDRMGIAAEMKSKLKPLGTGDLTKAAASGEADLAVWVIPGLIADPGVELAGPVPTEMQDYVNLTAGLSTAAKEAEPGKAFIKYLTSDAAKAAMKSKGWQPAPY